MEATGSQSRLGDGIRQVLTELRGAPPSAVVLLSDGQTTEGESLSKAAELAARKGVPLFTIGLGSAEPARDLELTELLVDDIVFEDDAVRFQAKLLAKGFAGQKVTLRLLERDPGQPRSQGGSTARVDRGRGPRRRPVPKRVELVHRPKGRGETDLHPRNRQAAPRASGREQPDRARGHRPQGEDQGPPGGERAPLRVPLPQELPGARGDDRPGRRLLSSDPEYSEQDRSALPTFPAAKDELFAYDVVIMGDADPGFLSRSQMQNLSEFVTEKGGGILFIAGEAFNPLAYRATPLETLLPIELADARNPTAVGNAITSYRPELTVEGGPARSSGSARTRPASARSGRSCPSSTGTSRRPGRSPRPWCWPSTRPSPAARGSWPWTCTSSPAPARRCSTPSTTPGGGGFARGTAIFGRFWVQAIRFLARSKLVGQRKAEIQTDRRRYERGQPIQLRVRFPNPALAPAGETVTVQVERNGLSPRKLTLNRVPGVRNVFEGALAQAAEGDYRVILVEPVLEPLPTANFRVDAPASEFERIQMNQAELLRVAATTGGKFYTPLTAESLVKDLPKPSKVPLDTDPPIPLWNTWPVLGLFLA